MSDEKILLPVFLLAELYKATLVEVDTFKASSFEKTLEAQSAKTKDLNIPAGKISQGKIKFLGENGKGVIIIVNQPDAVFLLEEELTFLTNILKACHLDLLDIAIINTGKEEIDYEALKEQLSAQTILLFDVEPSAIKLPFMIPVFQIQTYSGCTIMVAPPLHLLNKSDNQGKLLKTKLWLSLKTIFNIS